MTPNSSVTTFYGGQRKPGQGPRLGDDLKTIAKYIEYKAKTSPTYKVSDLSPRDRQVLFSSRKGEVKVNQCDNDNTVTIEYFDCKHQFDDPDLAAMLKSPNFFRSTSKIDAIQRAKEDAETAYRLAYANGDSHETAINKANAAYSAGYMYHHDNLVTEHMTDKNLWLFTNCPVKDFARLDSFAELPGITRAKSNPSPVLWGSASETTSARSTPQPTEIITSVQLNETEHVEAVTLVQLNETENAESVTPIQYNKVEVKASSPVQYNEPEVEAVSPVQFEEPVQYNAAEVDNGAYLPAHDPAGHLGSGLMEQYQTHAPFYGNCANYNYASPITASPDSGVDLYYLAYPELYVQPFAVPASFTESPVTQYSVTPLSEMGSEIAQDVAKTALRSPTPAPSARPQADQGCVSASNGISPVSPPTAHVSAFSPSAKCPDLKVSDNSPWKSMKCYEVPTAMIKELFPENFVPPAYWTTRHHKERYLRHKTSQLKYNDNKFRQDPKCGQAARGLVHVFIDMSNIQIGFWDTVKKQRGIDESRRIVIPRLSFKNLHNLMVRDRTVKKRCVATSHGLRDQQRMEELMETAKALGYYTMLLKRVSANGAKRQAEQGVDEMLHVQMLQSILDDRAGTMILATGDAKSAQYSDGFKATVERALRTGWNVELWAWEKGFSKEWEDEVFVKQWGPQFQVNKLDPFVDELNDISIETIMAARETLNAPRAAAALSQ
ncbi:hypothetical protein QBC38DRAFT_100511 [Podospora fimiseda]|uniref:NYN domain-containing protein n=1 Tax=Podospora fimiseda TaxID=252190 RepID=A0AAN6YSL2_9PEZI|nr:hypothetical protein QBC38DRAFT_100511 [Podospora fimiseda]